MINFLLLVFEQLAYMEFLGAEYMAFESVCEVEKEKDE